jgi:hypothetical protein
LVPLQVLFSGGVNTPPSLNRIALKGRNIPASSKKDAVLYISESWHADADSDEPAILQLCSLRRIKALAAEFMTTSKSACRSIMTGHQL